MNKIPKDNGLDNTLKIIKEAYTYVPCRLEEMQTKIFETRALGMKKMVVISGKEAAELFYDNSKISRKGTLPKRIVNTLFGKGAIHTTEGKVHVDRKALFMSLMTTENLKYLRELTRQYWFNHTQYMENKKNVNVYEEATLLLTKIGFRWAGLKFTHEEAVQNAKDMDLLIDSFSTLGQSPSGYKKAKQARARVEAFLEKQIKAVREGEQYVAPNTALYEFAHWKDLNDKPMDLHLCAVDLMNIVRPLVAVNRFITYAVKALIEYDQERLKLQVTHDSNYAYKFAQEVRRIFPFVPFLPGRLKKNVKFDGYKLKKGTFVLLDIFGTTHDPELFENPYQFKPDRFEHWDGSPFDLIPQGGGDFYTNHRCAGEWMTVIVMEEVIQYFANKIDFDAPAQDLSVKLDQFPGKVTSGVNITNVRVRR
ncbi:cytochrome P450 [Staphylococcus canis]|nr:cytochrome P450 [Staphylococcus canis]